MTRTSLYIEVEDDSGGSAIDSIAIIVNEANRLFPDGELIPSSYYLYQNYPNPFNAGTLIKYDIPDQGVVKINIYNIIGSRVITLIDEEQSPGSYSIAWNGLDSQGKKISSGIYFYILDVTPQYGSSTIMFSKKMVIIK